MHGLGTVQANVVAALVLAVLGLILTFRIQWSGQKQPTNHSYALDILIGLVMACLVGFYLQIESSDFRLAAFILALRALFLFQDQVLPAVRMHDLLGGALGTFIGLLTATLALKSWEFAVPGDANAQHVLHSINLVSLYVDAVAAVAVAIVVNYIRHHPRNTRTEV
jgi:hypothetical protein